MELRDIKEMGWKAQSEGSVNEEEQGEDGEDGSKDKRKKKETKKTRKIITTKKPQRKAQSEKGKAKSATIKRKKEEKLKEKALKRRPVIKLDRINAEKDEDERRKETAGEKAESTMDLSGAKEEMKVKERLASEGDVNFDSDDGPNNGSCERGRRKSA